MSIYPPIPDAPTPTREAYNASHFVGREEEVRAIRRKIEEGQAGYPMIRPVIHIWGAPGIGKSWLLQHLAHEYNSGPQNQIVPSPNKCGTLAAQVDFRDLELSQKNPLSIAQVVTRIFDQLQPPEPDGSLPEEARAFQAKYEQFKSGPDGAGEIPGLLKCFLKYVEWLTGRYVPLFLFDSVEKLPEDDFFWLEREIIAPLARTDRVLFILASRKELPRWKEFSVRQRLEVWELQGFDLQTTQEQLTRYALPEETAREIYPYTFGHPYANQVWSVAWREEGKPSEEKNLALLGQVERELLRDTALERERDILRTLSAPRRFNVESARSLLGQVVDKEFGTLSDSYYLRLFWALEQTNLVFWSSELRGYTISLPVRRILDLRIQMSDPEKFRQRHTFLRKFYEEWAVRNQLDRGALLLEALYHLARETTGETLDDRRSRVQQFLQTYLTEEQLDTDNADTFLRLFRGDQEFLGEAAVLPPMLQDEVQEQVKRLIPQDVYATSDRRS